MKKVHEIIISAEDKPNDNDYQYLIRVNGELEVCQDVKKDTLKICLVKGIYLTEDQEYTLCSLIENILLKPYLANEYTIKSNTDIIDIDLWRNKVGL